tara:strand:+ start:3647 stop:3811 length:165 start_codon:yes stop_codon:yes gene_type:complete
METVDLTPTWRELRPLAIYIIEEYIPVEKGQAFVLDFIEELVRVEDQLRKKQGE